MRRLVRVWFIGDLIGVIEMFMGIFTAIVLVAGAIGYQFTPEDHREVSQVPPVEQVK